MIITLHTQATSDERLQLMSLLQRMSGSISLHPISTTHMGGRDVIALDGAHLDVQAQHILEEQTAVKSLIVLKTPYQLVSRQFQAENTKVVIGAGRACDTVVVGDTTASPVIMAGPCAVENWEQLRETAHGVKGAGAHVLRGGAFKPRTSPYQFQGLGIEGLHLLTMAREETGLPVITEVMEPGLVETVAEHADVLQVGTRNMQNYPLLLAVGRHSQRRPVLLKRGLASTLEEWLLAAEYIVAAGNPNVILCERGIRSYDPQTRNMLDLTCIPVMQALTHLPIIVDPSHSTGKRELVPTMSRASIAAGAAGLIIEVHPDPNTALCDGRQSITPSTLQKIVRETRAVAEIMREERDLVAVA
jgi:3-deoxy-7-phosphoheptulonate synthase